MDGGQTGAVVGGSFPVTRWSMVVRAGGRDPASARRGLSELCRDYRRPLLVYAQRRGASPVDAEEAVQAFLASLVRPGAVRGASAGRGRFRAYLLGAFRHFLANEVLRARRLKRGGDVCTLSLETSPTQGDPISSEPGPDEIYDWCWASSVLQRAEDALRAEYERRGQATLFQGLFASLHEAPEEGYRELAVHLGLRPGAVRVAVHRMRRRFGELVRAEVADTLVDPAAVEDELRHLIAAIRSRKSL